MKNQVNFKIALDAEQSYIQSGINSIVEQYQEKFNKDKVYIVPTIQNYLKNSKDRLIYEIEIAYRRGLFFVAKHVRGAYLVEERRLAGEQGYSSPTADSFQDTTDNYLWSIQQCLSNPKIKPGSQIIAAGHNQETINHIKTLLSKPSNCKVEFAQLQGLGDHLTHELNS